MRRRQLLTASAIAVAGLAGCSSGTGSETESSGTKRLDTPKNAARTFYETLYGEDDIEGANALYHPESEEPPGKPEDFEEYGGLDAMTADVQSVELVSKSDGTAEVHVTVSYTTQIGAATNTDWFEFRRHEGKWMVYTFTPESAR